MTHAMNDSNPQTGPRNGVVSGDLFDLCVERKLMKDGSLEIHCKRGNFSVVGRECDKARVEQEARHYWVQYFADGEYASMTQPRH